MKLVDWIAEFLAQQNVRRVYEMSGGMITHLLDALSRAGRIRIVSVHHEQAASFAADAEGRVTGVPGVALATSGPGAVNLLTGIGSCYFDSSPAVFITGQVNRSELKGDRAIRQLGFQETDIVSAARPLVKAAWIAESPAEVPALLKRAFALAVEGRPGPVLVDIPMDVQRAEIPQADYEVPAGTPVPADATPVLDHLARAQRPLLLIGGGIRAARARSLLRRFAEATNTPVVHSLMAADVLPAAHPLRVGLLGTYGNRFANLAIGECDLLVVLGSRLDVRQTGSRTDLFAAGRTIVHVDCEAGEINNRVSGCIPILADLPAFLEDGLRRAGHAGLPDRAEWQDRLRQLKCRWPDTAEQQVEGIHPNIFMHQLSAVSAAAGAYAVDVGQHQMWAAQSLDLTQDQHFITSGGMGAMGFALPAAIGAAFALAPRPVVVIAGDGGFQTNIQELQTVRRNGLPIKMIIMNNGCHGMVRQFQESYFDSRFQSTVIGYSAPDFAAVATAYGIPARSVDTPDAVAEALEWLWQEPHAPALLQVMIAPMVKALPKVMFGQPIMDMEPVHPADANPG